MPRCGFRFNVFERRRWKSFGSTLTAKQDEIFMLPTFVFLAFPHEKSIIRWLDFIRRPQPQIYSLMLSGEFASLSTRDTLGRWIYNMELPTIVRSIVTNFLFSPPSFSLSLYQPFKASKYFVFLLLLSGKSYLALNRWTPLGKRSRTFQRGAIIQPWSNRELASSWGQAC